MGNNQKLETGIRITGRNYDSWNDNFRKNLNTGEYALIPGTQVYYDFKDIVSAAYVTYSQQLKKLSYQLGLRAENSNYEGEMKNTGERFANNFPISLFPSLYLYYKLGPKQDLQLNYSRKINRPGFFQLLPFVDFSDSLNLSLGNPALLPEFTNLAELNYSYQFKPGHSLMATLYGKNTEQLITRFQFKGPNTDISKPDSLLYNTFANADRSYTIGLELIGRNKLNAWWEITSNLNFFDVTLINANLPNAPDNRMFSWFGKLINNFKLPRNYSLQLSGDYQSKTILPVNSGRTAASNMYAGMVGNTQNLAQGFIKPIYGVDLSVKKDFWKDNKASLTLQFSDVLGSRANQVFATNDFFTQNNYRLRDPYMVRLNFNYRFGKFDASINKRKNTRTETENTSGM
jgi:outer membrane receptor protein involved in Fe transport